MGPFFRQGLLTVIFGITVVLVGLAHLMPLVQGVGKLSDKKKQTATARR
jgi:hypothetical protein